MMKILVLTGSHRKNSNSGILADNFIKGVQENGHEVVRFDSAFKNVHPCIACETCHTKGECAFKDDFTTVKETLLNCDMVVFATPIYYFGMSAQLKTVLDRFYAIDEQIHNNKKAVLLASLADTSEGTYMPLVDQYKATLDFLNWEDAGIVIAKGVWNAGDVNSTTYPQQAYELGLSIK